MKYIKRYESIQWEWDEEESDIPFQVGDVVISKDKGILSIWYQNWGKFIKSSDNIGPFTIIDIKHSSEITSDSHGKIENIPYDGYLCRGVKTDRHGLTQNYQIRVWIRMDNLKLYNSNESIDWEWDDEEESPISDTEERIKKYFNKKKSILIKAKNIEESRHIAKALKNMGYDVYNWSTIMNSDTMRYPNYINDTPGDFIRTILNTIRNVHNIGEEEGQLILTYDDFKNIRGI